MNGEKQVRPIRRFVLLLDDTDETVQDGVIVRRGISFGSNLDYTVLRVGTEEKCGFGQGDRVILCDPDAGRKLKLDGIPMRLVRVQDVIGVIE